MVCNVTWGGMIACNVDRKPWVGKISAASRGDAPSIHRSTARGEPCELRGTETTYPLPLEEVRGQRIVL